MERRVHPGAPPHPNRVIWREAGFPGLGGASFPGRCRHVRFSGAGRCETVRPLMGPPTASAERLRALVPRSRLITSLYESKSVPLVLLVAPAGFGKTTLLRQWDDADPRPFTWVEIGELERAVADLRPDGPRVVVLDDVHRLRGREPLDAVEAALEALPPGSQLALASREEPALRIGHLRAHRVTLLRPSSR